MNPPKQGRRFQLEGMLGKCAAYCHDHLLVKAKSLSIGMFRSRLGQCYEVVVNIRGVCSWGYLFEVDDD